MTRLALAALILLTACARKPTVTSGGIEVYEDVWRRAERDVRSRAARDFGCQGYDVDVVLLERQGRYPVAVRATGCGQEGRYKRRLRRHHGRLGDRNTTWARE